MRNGSFGMRNSDLHRTTLSALRNPRLDSWFGFYIDALSVLIRFQEKFWICRGALLRARTEFGFKGDEAFRHFEF